MRERIEEKRAKREKEPFYIKLAKKVSKGNKSKFEEFLNQWAQRSRVEIVYCLPIAKHNLVKYFNKDFFVALPNPLSIDPEDLEETTWRLVSRLNRESSDPDRYKKACEFTSCGRVEIRADYSYLFSHEYLNTDERTIAVVGTNFLMSTILRRFFDSSFKGIVFKHLRYQHEEDRVEVEIPLVFNALPNPLPSGSVLQFLSNEYILEAKVMPIPENLSVPQLCLIGPQEYSYLPRLLADTQDLEKRLFVVFKEGHEGLIDGLIQQSSGLDVINLIEEELVDRVNGELSEWGSLDWYPPRKGIVQMVTMPIGGQIEKFIRSGVDGLHAESICNWLDYFFRERLISTVLGIDVIETGKSSSEHSLVPINFRDLNFVKGEEILKCYREARGRYLDYVRANAIMPVQPVAVQLKWGTKDF